MIGILDKKFNLRKAVYNKSGIKNNELRGEKEEWIENFSERLDITYATPARRDTDYVGTDGGKGEYRQKRYLFWKLLDLLEIITNKNFLSEALEHDLSFCQMYNFLKKHKEVA